MGQTEPDRSKNVPNTGGCFLVMFTGRNRIKFNVVGVLKSITGMKQLVRFLFKTSLQTIQPFSLILEDITDIKMHKL